MKSCPAGAPIGASCGPFVRRTQATPQRSPSKQPYLSQMLARLAANIQRRKCDIGLDHCPWHVPRSLSYCSNLNQQPLTVVPLKIWSWPRNQTANRRFGVERMRLGEASGMGKAEDYRRYAGECLRLAQQSSSHSEKTLLLQMAETWRRLAEQSEGRSSRSGDQP